MSSLIPEYNYDVFISYRQKDNKHDGWVTEFVNNLKGELESTFKEEVSVYFDINPHDGLLETHDVDESLKEKLKCLIFIPIISRTYCDPKSFAWEHEFKAFIKQSKDDQLGLKVKVPGGNVASRVLPVLIHDLDPGDKKLVEDELGYLRSIEFIYREPGINKPLKPDDDEKKNLNKTRYSYQVNKVANAVLEIISGLISPLEKEEFGYSEPGFGEQEIREEEEILSKRKKTIGIIVGLILILFVGSLLFFQLLGVKSTSTESDEKSIAVLPFRNESPADSNAYFINGIMEEVITNLKKITDLRVISRTSVEQFRNTSKTIPQIAKALGVNYVLEGSGQKYGSKFNLSVHLIKAIKEDQLWAESYEKEIVSMNDICTIQRQIAREIATELKAVVTPAEINMIQQNPTDDLLAYQYYLQGMQYTAESAFDQAIEMFGKAIDLDHNFTIAYLRRSILYSTVFFTKGEHYSGSWENFDKLADSDVIKAMSINPELPDIKLTKAEQLYVLRHYDEALKLLDEIENQMINNPVFFVIRSNILRRKGEWRRSIEEVNKALILDPLNALYYNELGHTYQLVREYQKALDFYNKPKVLGIASGMRKEDMADIFKTMFFWKGDPEEALKASGLSADDIGYDYYYFSRQFQKLIPVTFKVETQFEYLPKTLRMEKDYFFLSDLKLCRQYADSAIKELKLKIREDPGDDRYYAAIAYAYAYIGDKKDAIENGRKAVELKPLVVDAWQGFEKMIDLAGVYVLTGDYDKAMDIVEELLVIPGDFSVEILKNDPICDPLRALPRFQKILKTEYITRY